MMVCAAREPVGRSLVAAAAGACPVIAPVSPRQKSRSDVAVHVDDASPRAPVGEHRESPGPLHHPAHRHAAEQRVGGPLVELAGSLVRADESVALALG